MASTISAVPQTKSDFRRKRLTVARSFVFSPDMALAAATAILLILAFPNFGLWFLAWFALVPLLIAVERNKHSIIKSFLLGTVSGAIFFFGSCWWLTFAPINYGGIPSPIAFALFIPVTIVAGLFTGVFCAALSRLLLKFGSFAILLAPFLWTACEWLRLLLTGNAWNALGYSQAETASLFIQSAKYGGVFLVSFLIVLTNLAIVPMLTARKKLNIVQGFAVVLLSIPNLSALIFDKSPLLFPESSAVIIALQPNVPMSGLGTDDYHRLRKMHVAMAETALREVESKAEWKDLPRIVVFPESPMNFAYAHDSEFREFLQDFAARNRISVIFNAGEPSLDAVGFHNSAVMVNERGVKIAQYDKIRLVPFGEYVPEWIPASEMLPTVVGRAKPGKEFRLMPLGSSVRGGVMICYESAFGDIARGLVGNGADVLIELTNDGYSGNTPILRQHLANAVFRAVETNRPVLRVTNVGITAFINERGEISDQTESYQTATRVWTIGKSNGAETFYVKYGDVFAAFCSILSLIFLALTFLRRKMINDAA